MTDQRTAYKLSPAARNSRTYMGSVLTVAISGTDTHGRAAVVEARARPGNEPPPHFHEWEDEFCYILDGAAAFYCGAERLVANAGDYLFIPQGTRHTFVIPTPALRMVIMASSVDGRPVGLDRYFVEMGEPAASMDLPAGATTHATADPRHAMQIAAANGTVILSPEEAAVALPHYPGVGSPER